MLASLRTSGMECNSVLDEEEESGADETLGSNAISDLITQGATLMAQTDRTGETALHLAARYARADAAKRLLDAGADPNAHDNMGRTPLHAAVAADAQGVFQVRGHTPLPFNVYCVIKIKIKIIVPHSSTFGFDFHLYKSIHWTEELKEYNKNI